jgi:hypothetical protein
VGSGRVLGGIRNTVISLSENVTAPPGRTYVWQGNIDGPNNASGTILDPGGIPTDITWRLSDEMRLRCQSTAAPPEGPGVSWDAWPPGGLTAHITDRSGVDSQCTYRADWYHRGFFLPANTTYDLVIWPAVPEFRNWNVTIACDNGARTDTTTYF